jgi:predicted TIM-barrel fold metal-dependent hydrolase
MMFGAAAAALGQLTPRRLLGAPLSTPSPKVFDSFTHILSQDLKRYPAVPLGSVTLKADTFADPVTADKLIAGMDANKIAEACVVQRAFIYGYDNSLMMDSVTPHRNRLCAVPIVNPADPATLKKVDEWNRKGLISSVRILGENHDEQIGWLDAPATLKLWDQATELGLPVDMEIYATNRVEGFPRLVKLMERRPKAIAVVDNLGFPTEQGAPDFGITADWQPLKDQPRIYIKLTSGYLLRLKAHNVDLASFLQHIVGLYGAERLMWGSDFGQAAAPYADLIQLGQEATAGLSSREKQLFLSENGRRLFWRDPK